MSKELKKLKAEELLAKQSANNEALKAFEAASLTSSPYYTAALAEKADIEAELASREGEMLAASVSEAVTKAVLAELKGKEGEIKKDTTLAVVISKSETGEIVVKTSAGKVRAASTGDGVSASSGVRGERKAVKITLLDGTLIEAETAAKGVARLKELQVIPQTLGESDSQVRVLKSIADKGIIKSFERVDAAPADQPSAPVVEAELAQVPAPAEIVETTALVDKPKKSK